MIGSALEGAVVIARPDGRSRRAWRMVHVAMARKHSSLMYPRQARLGALLWLVGLIACGAVAAAQELTELPELHGTVTDTTGGVIPGVLVELAGDEQVYPAQTDERGRYRLAGIRPGDYTLTVSLDGFQPVAQAVTLTSNRPTQRDVVLQLLFSTEVNVTAADSAPSTLGMASLLLTGQELDALPNDPDRLMQRLREMAGVTGQPGEMQVYVNGFRQVLRLPPTQAIQMIRISSNAFAPEFAEPGRVRVEIITKPGSGQYNGNFTFNFNDSALNAANSFAPRQAPVQMRDLTGYLGGPIVPNQWSFLFYVGRWAQDTDMERPVN